MITNHQFDPGAETAHGFLIQHALGSFCEHMQPNQPEIEEITARYSYDPNTGLFTATKNLPPRLKKGAHVARRSWNGYVILSCGKSGSVRAHRAAFAIFYGRWPNGDIDHINGVRDDNRIANLRDVDRGYNLINRHKAWGECGRLGVYRYGRAKNRYEARVNDERIGSFSTIEEAAMAAGKRRREILANATASDLSSAADWHTIRRSWTSRCSAGSGWRRPRRDGV